jgi:hypothetical protein
VPGREISGPSHLRVVVSAGSVAASGTPIALVQGCCVRAPFASKCPLQCRHSPSLLGGRARWPVSGRPVSLWVRSLPHIDQISARLMAGIPVRARRLFERRQTRCWRAAGGKGPGLGGARVGERRKRQGAASSGLGPARIQMSGRGQQVCAQRDRCRRCFAQGGGGAIAPGDCGVRSAGGLAPGASTR